VTRELVYSETMAEPAAAAYAEHAERIQERLPQLEVKHTGGSSVPGVLTAGDVDLQVRVEEEEFALAREVLEELYEPLHPHVWSGESAYFQDSGSDPPVEVALTVKGTIDDYHHGEAWEQMGADDDLRERYNDLKRAHADSTGDDYALAKREFFRLNFPKPS
jgi:GrpB-like predicted nucleotidyltransferase (UPF0157 family)